MSTSTIAGPFDLKAWRNTRNVSQAKLARMLGTPQRNIENWEQGLYALPDTLPLALESLDTKRTIVTLTCQGDNNWERYFPSRDAANAFLFEMIGRAASWRTSMDGAKVSDFLLFDIEDDLLVWDEGEGRKKKRFYGSGWHHSGKHPEKQELRLPDGQVWTRAFTRALEGE